MHLLHCMNFFRIMSKERKSRNIQKHGFTMTVSAKCSSVAFFFSSETEAKSPGDVSARLCLPQALEATYFGAGLRPPHILKYEMLEVKAVNAVQKPL